MRKDKLQRRRQEVGEEREADEERRRDELSLEVQPGNQGSGIPFQANVLIYIRNQPQESRQEVGEGRETGDDGRTQIPSFTRPLRKIQCVSELCACFLKEYAVQQRRP